MKKYSDRQKYKLIIWYYLLNDIKENDIENVLKERYPEYKIDYGGMSDMISWAARRKYARSCIYPWIIQTKNREWVSLHIPFEHLCDP